MTSGLISRLFLFSTTWIWCCTSVISQGMDKALTDIEEYRNTPQSLERDSVLIHAYNYLAEGYSGSNDNLAQAYIDTLKYLKEDTKWRPAEGLYLRALGKYHDRRGEFDLALDAYSQAIRAFESYGDQSAYIVYAYILKAFVLNNNGLHDQCFEQLKVVQPLAEQLENKDYLAWIIDFFGDYNFYSAFGQMNYPRALQYYLEVEKLLPEVNNPAIKADNAHGLAGVYLRLNQEEKALEYRDLALKLSEEQGFNSVIFAVYGDLADVYEEQGNWEEAIRHRKLSLDYAKKSNWIEMVARAENNIAHTYKLAGNYRLALQHFERLSGIEDSLARYDVQSKYAELEAKYESGRKDLEIEKLKSDKLRIGRNLLAILLFSGALFLIYYLYVNRTLRRKNEDLRKKHDEIQQALLQGRHMERERVSIELHDNINAKIAATKWMLETLNSNERDPEERDMIDRVVDSISEIYEDVRFMSHNLMPKDIESKSLPGLTQQLLVNLNSNQRIRFDFGISGESRPLDNAMKLQCYSIIMELVNNIIKHSGCKNAEVSLNYASEFLQIRVMDEGRGFDPGMHYEGAGLKNVRSRVETLGGRIRIDGNRPAGTDIFIEIPYSESLVRQA